MTNSAQTDTLSVVRLKCIKVLALWVSRAHS
jgi:hypothetical protein